LSIRRSRNSELAERFPGLLTLCGYLGQSWDYEYGTPEAAVQGFCAGWADDRDVLSSAAAGLDALFIEFANEATRLDALDPMGFNYAPRPGKLDEFFVWARKAILDVVAGAEPQVPLRPIAREVESPEMFLLRFPHMSSVGERYFSSTAAFASPEDAMEAYVQVADENESGLTFAALNMLHREPLSEEQARALLAAAGWQRLPRPGELGDFLAFAVNLFVYSANVTWQEERGLEY
jgi:hypothetical protein